MGWQMGGRPLAAYLQWRSTGRWAVYGRLPEQLHRAFIKGWQTGGRLWAAHLLC